MKSLFMKRRPAIHIEAHPEEGNSYFRPWVRTAMRLGQYAIGIVGWVGFAYLILSMPSPM